MCRICQAQERNARQLRRSSRCARAQSEHRRRRHVRIAASAPAPPICQRVTGRQFRRALHVVGVRAPSRDLDRLAAEVRDRRTPPGCLVPSLRSAIRSPPLRRNSCASGSTAQCGGQRQRRRRVGRDRPLLPRALPRVIRATAPRYSFAVISSVPFPIVLAECAVAASFRQPVPCANRNLRGRNSHPAAQSTESARPVSVNCAATAWLVAIRSRSAGVVPRYTLKPAVPAAKLKPDQRHAAPASAANAAVTRNDIPLSFPLASTARDPRNTASARRPASRRVPIVGARLNSGMPGPTAVPAGAGAMNATLTLASTVPSLAVVSVSAMPNWMLPFASTTLPTSGRGIPTPLCPAAGCRRRRSARCVSAYQASS